ncbi:MAG: PIN/TRAM domain-containing protein [Planctomycetes bacterium]|nr:PIN/TRAM domain-containing protein [Planctomycetota bacterium]
MVDAENPVTRPSSSPAAPAASPAERPSPAAPAPSSPAAAGKVSPEDHQRAEALRQSSFYQRPRAAEIQDRITLYVIRGLFFLIAPGIGLYINRLYPESNLLLTVTVASGIALVVMLGEIFFSRASIHTLSAIALGLIMGLALSFLFQPIVELIANAVSTDQITPKEIKLLQLIVTTFFCYLGITVLLQNKENFKFIIPYVEFRKEIKGHTPFIIDTSAIIDGRIAKLLETRIIDQRLVIPKFVLNELQVIADSQDRSRRERGRRGMDILEEIRRQLGVEILERDLPPGAEVDRELLAVVDELKGKLLTSDFNLQKRASLQGIPVINLNDLATALKPVFVPGEHVRVKLLREGDEPEQAIGFLDDGTMVVVERSSRKVGQEVSVEVTSATQTSAGKMIFGRLAHSFRQRPRREGGRGPDRGGRDAGGQ